MTTDETHELYQRTYDELKRMARHHLRAEQATATLSTTELVHESYLKLRGGSTTGLGGTRPLFRRRVPGDASGPGRFRAPQARQKAWRWRRASVVTRRRRGVAGRARRDPRARRGARALAVVDERLRQIVELRFFGGFSEREVADFLGVTPRTVERNWLKARLFLLRELRPGDDAGAGQPGVVSGPAGVFRMYSVKRDAAGRCRLAGFVASPVLAGTRRLDAPKYAQRTRDDGSEPYSSHSSSPLALIAPPLRGSRWVAARPTSFRRRT